MLGHQLALETPEFLAAPPALGPSRLVGFGIRDLRAWLGGPGFSRVGFKSAAHHFGVLDPGINLGFIGTFLDFECAQSGCSRCQTRSAHLETDQAGLSRIDKRSEIASRGLFANHVWPLPRRPCSRAGTLMSWWVGCWRLGWLGVRLQPAVLACSVDLERALRPIKGF